MDKALKQNVWLEQTTTCTYRVSVRINCPNPRLFMKEVATWKCSLGEARLLEAQIIKNHTSMSPRLAAAAAYRLIICVWLRLIEFHCGDQDCVLQNTFDVITSKLGKWFSSPHHRDIASASLSTTDPSLKTIKRGVTSPITMSKFNFEHFFCFYRINRNTVILKGIHPVKKHSSCFQS